MTCQFCKEEKENIEKRDMRLPGLGLMATSQDKMCDDCFNKLQAQFKKQDEQDSV